MGEDETHRMCGIGQMDGTDCWMKQTGNRLGRLMDGWVSNLMLYAQSISTVISG